MKYRVVATDKTADDTVGALTTRGCAIAILESLIAKPLYRDQYVQAVSESGECAEEFRFPEGYIPAFVTTTKGAVAY
jgi:hypothetical protein